MMRTLSTMLVTMCAVAAAAAAQVPLTGNGGAFDPNGQNSGVITLAGTPADPNTCPACPQVTIAVAYDPRKNRAGILALGTVIGPLTVAEAVVVAATNAEPFVLRLPPSEPVTRAPWVASVAGTNLAGGIAAFAGRMGVPMSGLTSTITMSFTLNGNGCPCVYSVTIVVNHNPSTGAPTGASAG